MRHLIIPLIAAAASVLSTAAAYADLGDQLFKLLPNDGGPGNTFGNSVAISGTTAIVGASSDDNDNGISSGSAYLFDSTTGVLITKLLADDGESFDSFGFSIAISGDTAIVGAPHDDDIALTAGSAYLFDVSDPAKPTQMAKLLPDDGAADDRFGFSVTISGATAIVGSPNHDANDDIDNNAGSAYLFDTTTGLQVFKLLPNDGAANHEFGRSVGISGNIAIVGAVFGENNGEFTGSAYLFDTTTGRQIAKLLADDGAEFDGFGQSVAISGDITIIGAFEDDDNGLGSGSAYVFDISDPANPTQLFKLLPDDGALGDGFGWSVAISGTTAIVGARWDDDNGNVSGSAYLFDTTTGLQIAKLLPDDGAAGDQFGYSIAISGATAIVGARYDDDNGTNSGSAYLFDAAAPGTCPWDLDGSGSVGTSDLLALFAQWGTAGPADFDSSGAVDTSDLLILFANWGPCP